MNFTQPSVIIESLEESIDRTQIMTAKPNLATNTKEEREAELAKALFGDIAFSP